MRSVITNLMLYLMQGRHKSLIQQHKQNHDLHTRLLQERQAAQEEDAHFQKVR